MSAMTPTQQGGHLVARMMQRGAINAAEEADRMGVSRAHVYRALDELSALHTVAIANDRGWWYVNTLEPTDYEAARRLLAVLKEELAGTQHGTLFCRAMRRSDVATLVRLLCRMVEARPEPTA